MAAIESRGFPPVAGPDARVLVLGSLPGRRSLQQQQYYAHPQNAFWKIMAALYSLRGSYDARCAQLIQNRIALWDVLASSVRPGSMDADIDIGSARANDFGSFLASHEDIELIVFNGRKAENLFHRFVDTDALQSRVRLAGLPSTSPAYAAMPFSVKLSVWRETLRLDEQQARRGS